MTGQPSTVNRAGTQQDTSPSALQQSEERLRLVLQSTQDGIWDWDVKNDSAYCSERWKAMRGLALDELQVTSEQWIQGIHPEDREAVTQAMEAHLTARAPFDIEYRVLCQDGSHIWVRDRGQALWNEAGEVVRMVGSETDITDRKLAEEALKHQYERSQLLSDITLKIRQSLALNEVLQTAVTEVQQFLQADRVLAFKLHPDGSGHVVQESVVPGWTAALGYNIIDPCFQKDYVNLYREGRISSIDDLSKSKIQPCHIELLSQFEVKANLVVPILFQNTIWGLLIAHQCSGPRSWTTDEMELLQQIANQMGIALSQAQMFDQLEQKVEERTAELSVTNLQLQGEIDERLHIEQLLRKSQETFRTLVTNLPQAVYRCLPDQNWTITFISETIASISGYLATDFIQNRVRTLASMVYPDDRARVAAAVQTAIAQKTPYHLHYRIVNAEGNIRWIADQGRGIFDRDGDLLYLDGTISDINDYKQAVQKLETSEAQYRALVETSQSLIWSVDTEGHVTFMNGAAQQVYGYEPEEMLGRLFFEFGDPQTIGEARSQFQALLSEQSSFQFERVHLSKTGKPISLLFNAIALRDAAGQVEQIIGTASDITDLKWDESFQKIKNDVLDLMTQGRSLQEILQTLTLKINHLLPGLHSTIMLMRADGQHLDSFVGPGMPSAYLQAIDGLPIGPNAGCCGTAAYLGQRVVVENIATDPLWADYREMIRPHGFKACWSEPIKFETDRVLGSFGMYFDEPRAPQPRELRLIEACAELASIIITRKQSEEALRYSETRLRLTTDALPALIAYVDHQQCYQFANHAYEAWFGKPREQIIGHSVCELLGEPVYQQLKPLIEAALLGHRTESEEEVSIVQQGTRFIHGTYIPEISEGKVQGYFFLGNDITEQKRVERMKDEFISVVSHELRTPLTSIYGSLKLLSTSTESDFSEDDQYMLKIAVDSSERLVRLINDVLDLERITSGKAKILKQPCNASDLITQAAEAMRAMATEQNVTFSLQPTPLRLWADPDHIHQTLTNLLSNAIKFSSPGSTVWLHIEEQDHEILFEVKDQGRGIPADQLGRIFERFQQVDGSDSREKGGTGLGLAICQNIVQEHGGRIWAESVLHEGSRFYFTLPKLDPSQSSVPNPEVEKP